MNYKYVLPLVFVLTLTSSLSDAQNKYPPPIDLDLIEIVNAYYTPSDNIFFEDPENNMILIDFQSVKDRITKIDIKQNDQLVFEEQVSHLSSQTIYELPADLFKSGICKIEISTKLGFKYSQKIKTQTTIEKNISMN